MTGVVGPRADGSGLRERAAADLKEAMRRRDRTAVSALRSALAAIANAEAVPVEDGPRGVGGQHVAGGVVGLGAGEAQRRELDDATVAALVRHEASDRLAVAAELEGLDGGVHGERAGVLRTEAAVLLALLDGP